VHVHKVLSVSRKWGVALLGVVAQAAASGAVPDKYAPWAAVVVAVATAVGVYSVPNAAPAGDAP
jgi:hypothetical protein